MCALNLYNVWHWEFRIEYKKRFIKISFMKNKYEPKKHLYLLIDSKSKSSVYNNLSR